jgi:hypothetical protein
MKYAVEMDLGGMPSIVNTGSGIHMLKRDIHRQHGDCISLIYYFKTKKTG